MTAAIDELMVSRRHRTNGRPLVTAITIFLNAERFIDEAIQSVFAQTYEQWELLLIDDGSTDASRRIAQDYASEHPQKVRCLEHPGRQNRGMSASRNLGLEHARGEFVAFLDADDVWLPEKLEQQVEILNAHPEAAMVYGAIQYWYSWTGASEDSGRDFIPDLGVQPDTLVSPPTLVGAILKNQIATTTGSLARRERLQEVGGYEESFRGLFEDQVLHSKLSLKEPVFVSSKCWYKYRKHPDSCCAVAERNGEHHSERLTFLNWLEAYTNDQGVENTQLQKVIKSEIWKSRHTLLSGFVRHANYRVNTLTETLKSLGRRALPATIYRFLRNRRNGARDSLPIGLISFGDLRRLTPVSRVFGFDRGTPVDRYYIENFLAGNASDVRGRVLEVGENTYTHRFGGDGVVQSDVLHVSEANPQATIIADLANADHIPSDTFDCVILTQTLQLIYDVRTAIATLYRILKPGGVLLATIPGISQIDHHEWGNTWYWAFTSLSARRLFGELFPPANVSVETHGNVLTATAFLQGLALEELHVEELDHHDPDYQVIIAVRAAKEAEA